MKTKLLLLVIFGVFFSCEEEGSITQKTSTVVVNEGTAMLKNQGAFAPTSGITVSGSAKIFLDNGQNKLELVDFSISSGPDLKVYLSKSNTPTEFVNLGNLNPSTVYVIPKDVDLKQYPFVLIHCQQYNHLFAVAELTQN